jgi:hypothetical protein
MNPPLQRHFTINISHPRSNTMSRGLGFPAEGVPNQGWRLSVVSITFVILAGLTTAARCATRLHTRQLGPDDYTILYSLVSVFHQPQHRSKGSVLTSKSQQLSSIVLSVAIQLAVTNGYGMHRADLTKQELSAALKWFFIAQTPYKIVVALNKVSAILFCQRIFVGKAFQYTCWTCMGTIVSWNIGAIAATILQCIPVAGSWDKTIVATCIDSKAFWVAYAVGNILTDAMVLALPIPEVLRLRLKLREKVMLCGVFLLGGM